MKSRLALVLTAALAAAACSSQDDAAVAARPGRDAPVAGLGGGAMVASRIAISDAATRHRFAAMPDRGALTVYPKTPVVRRDGAYTWHRADLSESHARSAIGGVLAVTTPSGQLLRFRYERHVEHPNGDWTWVGSLGNGSLQEAVITFGAKAAFGSIGQPGGDALRLTMRNGASWLVETDLAEIAKLDHVGTRPRRPDYLVVPELPAPGGPRAAAQGAATVGTPRAASVGAVASATAAATTVDLVLGYTTGFASMWGGESQAQTRLNNMVEVTNEAYANSQIDARVRLVRTVQVNYPDTTTNEVALEELTGYRDGSTITPNAAFNGLRAARDQYGGDLVSLVRRFSSGNEGCGIAWLIGGGRRGSIAPSSERFGYSVVGDGDYSEDGKTYFCRQETLAHELGHNMGAQHDRDTADGDDNVLQENEYGVYDYSFGYKTGAGAGNFYTVMAYGDSGQVRNRIFSNPRISKCGAESNTHPRGIGPSTPVGTVPCGTAAADNARTLSQTTPVIATFRATVVVDAAPVPLAPAPGDMNGDGKSDLLWRNPASTEFAYWIMNGGQAVRTVTTTSRASGAYWVAATGDVDNDKRVDAIWTSDARDLWLWTNTGGDFGAQLLGYYPEGWVPIAAADVNGDSKADLLWRHPSSGQFAYWILDGATVVRTVTVPARASSTYRVAAIGDFNADGRADLVWTSPARDLWMWIGDGTGFSAQSFGSYPAEWSIVGAGDLSSDGRSDIFWRNAAGGAFAYWVMNGASVLRTHTTISRASAAYYVAAIGDYNGDGASDVVWTSPSRDVWVWTWNGSDFTATYAGGYPLGWEVVWK